MANSGGFVLRILGIIVLSMIVGLASLFLALVTICGGLSNPRSAPWFMLITAGIAGGIFGIANLARQLREMRSGGAAGTDAGAGEVEPEAAPLDPALAPERLLQLRIALGASLGVSLLSMMMTLSRGSSFVQRYLPYWVASVVLGQAPNLWVLWAVRSRIHAWAAAFAASYAGFGLLQLLWNLLPAIKYGSGLAGETVLLWGLRIGVDVAMIVTGLRAHALVPEDERRQGWPLAAAVALLWLGALFAFGKSWPR